MNAEHFVRQLKEPPSARKAFRPRRPLALFCLALFLLCFAVTHTGSDPVLMATQELAGAKIGLTGYVTEIRQTSSGFRIGLSDIRLEDMISKNTQYGAEKSDDISAPALRRRETSADADVSFAFEQTSTGKSVSGGGTFTAKQRRILNGSKAQMYCAADSAQIRVGDMIYASGTFACFDGPANPGCFDARRYYRSTGCENDIGIAGNL